MLWLQDWQEQIHRNFLTDDAVRLILGGFQTTLVILIYGAIWVLALASFLTYLHIVAGGFALEPAKCYCSSYSSSSRL